MATFPIRPVERFGHEKCAMKRPKEIGCFSFDDDHEYRSGASSLKYYYTPQLGVSLSNGYDHFKKLDDSKDDHLDALLKTIIATEQDNNSAVTADFITWRGMMTKFLTAAFNTDGFEMRATRYQGTIFIEENHQHKLRRNEMEKGRPPRAAGLADGDLMSYWGYKFETLCTLPDTWDNTPREFIESRDQLQVNNHAQYCSVVQTTIKGQSTVIMGGEVDAVWDHKSDNPEASTNWVELKTYREFQPSHAENLRFERRLLKFWAQSFLLGVPKIVIGFRSDDKEGRLLRVMELKTTSIPAMVREGRGTWDITICLNCAAQILDFLKANVGGGVWIIRRQERSWDIELFREENVSYSDILSPEFIEWRDKLAQSQGNENGQPSTVGVAVSD